MLAQVGARPSPTPCPWQRWEASITADAPVSTTSFSTAGRGRLCAAATAAGAVVAAASAAGKAPVRKGAWQCSESQQRRQPMRTLRTRSRAADSEGLPEEDDLAFSLQMEALRRGIKSEEKSDFAILREDFKDVRPGDVLLLRPLNQREPGDAVQALIKRIAIPTRLGMFSTVPVMLITRHSEEEGTEGVLLTERTRALMGDFVEAFQSRPLYVGGPKSSEALTMVHPYPNLPEGEELGYSGLFMGKNIREAQEFVEDINNACSSLRFRFFIGKTQWGPGELEKEIVGHGFWWALQLSRELIVNEDLDRPLYAAILALANEEVQEDMSGWTSE